MPSAVAYSTVTVFALAGVSVTVKAAVVVPALPSATLVSLMARDGVAVLAPCATKSVTLWAGSRLLNVFPARGRSAGWEMELPGATSWRTSTVPVGVKFARLTVVGVAFVSLLTTMTVSEPSAVRCAAKADSRSALVSVTVETLVSPKVDFAPS